MNTVLQLKQNRPLLHSQSSEAVTDGDGVRINRSVARKALHTFDPFLLLDEIASDDTADYIGGFPEHPHRGFETVTYMLEGRMRHRDHLGNEGLLESGSVQWMTAGRGVLHSEMPEQHEGRMHGFQLWINLPAAEKMSPPNYREYDAQQIPVLNISDHSSIKVIAGTVALNGQNIQGPVAEVSTQPDYFDINLAANESLNLPLASHKQVLVYVYQGAITIHSDQDSDAGTLLSQQLGMLGAGEQISMSTTENSRLLLLAGNPLNEPVVNWGPFVMNTREEIEQAISDYRNGTLVD